MIKKIATLFAAILIAGIAVSQTPRTVIVEHFTNTDCSICGSKNPTFFATLRGYPDVLHIAYHPDLPHPTCLLSHEDRAENIARTQLYNVYGATPRAVIQGTVIPVKTPTIDSLDIDTMLHKYSPLALSVHMLRVDADSIEVSVTVRTTATHTYGKMYLLANVTEDTIFYTGTNGEPEHFDVFHKQLFAGLGHAITPAAAIGDSLVLHSGFRISAVDSIWDRNRINLISMVQDSASRFIYQAAKQTKVDTLAAAPTGIVETAANTTRFYPNPALEEIIFSDTKAKNIAIYSISGQVIKEDTNITESLSIAALPAGLYYIHIKSADGVQSVHTLSVIH